jgi:hypothetical protein
LLDVLDEVARSLVREAVTDEIYVKDPVLMVVEPKSLCWLSGRLNATVSSEGWQRESAALPQLEQVTRDGGSGLAKGMTFVNAQRQAAGRELIAGQGDHIHA